MKSDRDKLVKKPLYITTKKGLMDAIISLNREGLLNIDPDQF